jgi:heme a synthase
VGALILVIALLAWRFRQRLPHSAAWPLATLLWVIVQGAFGKYTVTLKLYPAVVTAHLLGGLVLLALLVAQVEARRGRNRPSVRSATGLGIAVLAALLLVVMQAALGGWVSTNYAVLACRGFPQCNGQWWPAMQAAGAFELLRPLGRGAQGEFLNFDTLVTIHFAHRLFAVAVVLAVGSLAWALWRNAQALRRHAAALFGLLAAQITTGASNVVLDWPIFAALAHSAGAAALTALLCSLWLRTHASAVHSGMDVQRTA